MEESNTENKSHLLEQIRTEGMSVLEDIYRIYQADFLAFAARFELPKIELLDAYQDAIIAFYENVQAGKLTQLTSSPKTYLFSIGKYILMNRQKNNNRFLSSEGALPELEFIDNQYVATIELDHQQELIQQAFLELGAPCQELLRLFYFHQYSIKNIQSSMNYVSENTVKASKSRCMKNLKDILQKMDVY